MPSSEYKKYWLFGGVVLAILVANLLMIFVFSTSDGRVERDELRARLLQEIGMEMSKNLSSGGSCQAPSREKLDEIQRQVDPEYTIHMIELEIISDGGCLVKINLEQGGQLVYKPISN